MVNNKIINRGACCDCFYCQGTTCTHNYASQCTSGQLWTPIWDEKANTQTDKTN